MLIGAGVKERPLFGSHSQEQGTSVTLPHGRAHVLLLWSVRDESSLTAAVTSHHAVANEIFVQGSNYKRHQYQNITPPERNKEIGQKLDTTNETLGRRVVAKQP